MATAHCFDPEQLLTGQSQTSTTGKFVLMNWQDDPYLLIGPLKRFAYHADLVQAFAESNQIPFTRASTRDRTVITSTACTIHGGGWVDLNGAKRSLQFHGHSTAYGGFEPEQLKEVCRQLREFVGWSLELHE